MIVSPFSLSATPQLYTLSLHDALPISRASISGRVSGSLRRSGSRGSTRPFSSAGWHRRSTAMPARARKGPCRAATSAAAERSEEHTSELQSRLHLVCRLLLEKKKKKQQ